MATTIEASQSLIQSESRVHSYQEVVTETRQVKKKTKSRRHKDEGSISVSKSSEKLYKKMKADNENPTCAKCSRPVYAMERVKAEKRAWHKECFRCVQCNKQLTVETYQSDHTTLYCKPHFKQLFEPKPVDDDDEVDAAPKKHQMIICESQPVELPPDVVRASDKPDLGLEELASLDVKSRFEVFERKAKAENEPVTLEPRVPREKSATLLSKLAKFKAKGMDIGVSDEYLNGVPVEHSSSEHEDEEDEDSVLKNSYAHNTVREQTSLCDMNELVGRFENGPSNAERHNQRKQEIQNIRSRLFLGKQAKIKEMYEQSVMQCEQSVTSADKIARELDLDAEKARAIKQRFENGEIFNDENQPPKNRELDDPSLFNEGIAKKSRSIFLELDANAKQMAPLSPPAQEPPKRKEIPFVPKDVIRAADKLEDVHIETAHISDRFKFFETYKPETTRKEFRMTPPRQPQRAKSPSPELYHELSVVRGDGEAEGGDASVAAARHTASRMISVFREMEESRRRDEPQGPKPLKRFTPPPVDEIRHYSSSEYSDSESDDYDEREALRERDEALKQAQALARTTSFRDRFEHWSEGERDEPRHSARVDTRDCDDGESQLETAKSLREKFENMKVQTSTVTKSFAPKVNRFVRAKSPSPELYHELSVVRGDGEAEGGDASVAAARHTASRMISVFREMEESRRRDEPQGPKPLKRFTPPPVDEIRHYSSSEYSDSESDDYDEREALRERDEALKQAQALARTTSFRDRFEHWSEGERDEPRHSARVDTRDCDDGESQLETAKSLREKFENMKVQTSTVTKSFAPKVNRFV